MLVWATAKGGTVFDSAVTTFCDFLESKRQTIVSPSCRKIRSFEETPSSRLQTRKGSFSNFFRTLTRRDLARNVIAYQSSGRGSNSVELEIGREIAVQHDVGTERISHRQVL
jgi:hypothetical protein